VVHYSIPNVDGFGVGHEESSDSIESAKLRASPDDVLISRLNPDKTRVVLVQSHELPVVVSGEFIVLRAYTLDRRFLRYFLTSDQARQELTSRMKSVTRSHQRVLESDVLDLRIPDFIPDEQARIADFLDRETERIDLLMDKKRRLIDLLEEKRTALITQAVTKGLDPTVPMKDSGVPWIGDVPAHWNVRRLGHIARIVGGTGFPDSYQGLDTADYPFYKVSDMTQPGNETRLGRSRNYVDRQVVQELGGTLVPADSIVFPKVGAALLTNKRRLTSTVCLIDNNCMALVFERGQVLYWLGLLSAVDLGEVAQLGPVPSVSGGVIKELRLPEPPIPEQGAITECCG
jgi:restriction endonuclease S subunit